eukprot:1753364-Rhodomonas_salina.1
MAYVTRAAYVTHMAYVANVAYGSCLRERGCALLGTGIAYRAIAAYAISDTDLAYGATRCPVLTWRVVLRDV